MAQELPFKSLSDLTASNHSLGVAASNALLKMDALQRGNQGVRAYNQLIPTVIQNLLDADPVHSESVAVDLVRILSLAYGRVPKTQDTEFSTVLDINAWEQTKITRTSQKSLTLDEIRAQASRENRTLNEGRVSQWVQTVNGPIGPGSELFIEAIVLDRLELEDNHNYFTYRDTEVFHVESTQAIGPTQTSQAKTRFYLNPEKTATFDYLSDQNIGQFNFEQDPIRSGRGYILKGAFTLSRLMFDIKNSLELIDRTQDPVLSPIAGFLRLPNATALASKLYGSTGGSPRAIVQYLNSNIKQTKIFDPQTFAMDLFLQNQLKNNAANFIELFDQVMRLPIPQETKTTPSIAEIIVNILAGWVEDFESSGKNLKDFKNLPIEIQNNLRFIDTQILPRLIEGPTPLSLRIGELGHGAVDNSMALRRWFKLHYQDDLLHYGDLTLSKKGSMERALDRFGVDFSLGGIFAGSPIAPGLIQYLKEFQDRVVQNPKEFDLSAVGEKLHYPFYLSEIQSVKLNTESTDFLVNWYKEWHRLKPEFNFGALNIANRIRAYAQTFPAKK